MLAMSTNADIQGQQRVTDLERQVTWLMARF
jgi:hypothetical protein